MLTASSETTNATAARWVEAFAEGWRDPKDADSFCDHFEPWLHPEIRMVQPNLPTLTGFRDFREGFARPLFDLAPDLHGAVESWASDGDLVYISLRLEGTIGSRQFALSITDRVTLRDGKAIERVAYSDPTPFLKAVALSPRSWPRFARMQLRNLKKGRR